MSNEDDDQRYPRGQRFGDRRRGRRDGRRRQPGYNDLLEMAETSGITAAHPERLLSQAADRMEAEYIGYEQRTVGARAELARLREQRKAAVKAIDRSTETVATAQAPLTEAELRPRNHAELASENQVMVVGRREAMRDHRIAVAHGDKEKWIAALNEIDGRIAAVNEQIKKEFVVAQALARRVGEQCATRVATYWENVVLVHPEGEFLAPVLRFTAKALPSWVIAPPDSDPADLGRGPSEQHRVVQALDVQRRQAQDGTGEEEEAR